MTNNISLFDLSVRLAYVYHSQTRLELFTYNMLSTQTIEIIKATTPVVRDHGLEVTKVFYSNLLDENPALNEVFNQGNQINGHQARALAAAVYAYAQHIEDPSVLGPAIQQITQKHASLFIKPEQYDVVGRYLLEAFGQVLGDAFTSQVRDAWAAAYSELAQTMINAETELYRQQAKDWTDWKDFVVRDIIAESLDIKSFILKPVDGSLLPTYLPGQYISIRVFVPSLGYRQPRQYSLSDRYSDDHYRISVKREHNIGPGLVSNALHGLKAGDRIQLSRPYGTFVLDITKDESSPLVLISAGVGLTPMLSMLNTVVAEQPGRFISWIHGYRSAETRAFADHINVTAQSDKNVRVIRFCSKPQPQLDNLGVDFEHIGRVDLDKCEGRKDLFLDDTSAKYYVCGPNAFMSQMKDQLLRYGVQSGRIQVEEFGTGGS